MKARVPQAAAWDDLKISTSTRVARFVDVPPNSFTDHMLTVEQMIPISGKNQSRARIAAAEAVGTLEELRRKEFDVVLKVRTAFIRLVNTRALLELNRATEGSLAQTLTISRGRLEVGAQSQTDVLTAESGVIRIAEARRDLERTLSEQETQLKVLMNRDAFAPLGEPAGELPSHAALELAPLRALILSHRPELRMASANLASAAAKVELAKREWIPDPTLSVGAQRYNESSQAVSELTAGVSFNVPWVNPRKYRAGESEAQSTATAAQRALEGAQQRGARNVARSAREDRDGASPRDALSRTAAAQRAAVDGSEPRELRERPGQLARIHHRATRAARGAIDGAAARGGVPDRAGGVGGAGGGGFTEFYSARATNGGSHEPGKLQEAGVIKLAR